MAQLTADQVAQLAKGVGLKGEAAAIAVAIAGFKGSPSGGESHGRTDALGDTTITNATWGPSVGLWQIRSLHRERQTGRSRDATRLRDPQFNARAMFEISSGGTNWQPWSVYKSGSYKANMKLAQAAVGISGGPFVPGPGGGGVSTSLASVGSVLQGAGTAAGLFTDPGFLLRIGYGLAGIGLVLGGGLILFGDLAGNTKVLKEFL